MIKYQIIVLFLSISLVASYNAYTDIQTCQQQCETSQSCSSGTTCGDVYLDKDILHKYSVRIQACKAYLLMEENIELGHDYIGYLHNYEKCILYLKQFHQSNQEVRDTLQCESDCVKAVKESQNTQYLACESSGNCYNNLQICLTIENRYSILGGKDNFFQAMQRICPTYVTQNQQIIDNSQQYNQATNPFTTLLNQCLTDLQTEFQGNREAFIVLSQIQHCVLEVEDLIP